MVVGGPMEEGREACGGGAGEEEGDWESKVCFALLRNFFILSFAEGMRRGIG